MKRAQFGYPTLEDLLDVNFRAIVSDCRAIIAGTLVPRPWSDISTTWLREDSALRNHPVHRSPQVRRNVSKAAKQAWIKRDRGPSKRLVAKKSAQFRTAVHLLEMSGYNTWDARMKARQIIKWDGPLDRE